MTKRILLLPAALMLSLGLKAQNPSFTYIDINDIKAGHFANGAMWMNPSPGSAACEYPKGSGKHIMFFGSLWLAGTTSANQLRTSASMPDNSYSGNLNDCRPGPIDTPGMMTQAHGEKWNRIWKLNKTTIDAFRSASGHTTANTPADILEWPATGNPYAKGANGASLTITQPLAPFVDANGDGHYNALDGDYPKIKGDQMLWWVFNDNNFHVASASDPLGVEVQASVYGYTNPTLTSVLYYNYKIVNKGGDLSNFTAGLYTDADLGYAFDDYIGFDSTHRMGILYNGKSVDGNGQTNAYGSDIPMAGISLLETEGDGPNARVPAGSFNYFNNDNSDIGNPDAKEHFYNCLTGKTSRGGNPMTRDYAGAGIPSKGYGSGPQTKYVFDGDPSNASEWSECASVNSANDRRMIIAARPRPTVFAQNSSQQLTFALIARRNVGGCPNAGFGPIKSDAETVWFLQRNVGVEAAETPAATAQVYPNPARRDLHVALPQAATATLVLTDLSGRRVLQSNTSAAGRADLDLSPLSPGIYLLHISSENGVAETRKVVVQ